MKQVLFMLVMFGLVLSACGAKESEEPQIEQKPVQQQPVQQQPVQQQPVQQQNVVMESKKTELQEEPILSEEEAVIADKKAFEFANSAKKEIEQGNKDKALELFNMALKARRVPWVLADRGKLKMDMNDIEGAVVDLTSAIRREKRKIYYIWRADAYKLLGKNNLAEMDIKEANSLPKEDAPKEDVKDKDTKKTDKNANVKKVNK